MVVSSEQQLNIPAIFVTLSMSNELTLSVWSDEQLSNMLLMSVTFWVSNKLRSRDVSALHAAKIDELPAIETKAPVSEDQRLTEFTDFYRRMNNANLGPFEQRKKEIYDLCVSMKQKNDNLHKLLRESFSTEDLTYNTYMSTLNEVMRIFNNNLGGIKKRIEVFDYNDWKNDRSDEHATAYISEVEDLYKKNYVVIDHIDDLMHELVNLDDISDVPLEKVNRLIEQTQDYKKIKERQW